MENCGTSSCSKDPMEYSTLGEKQGSKELFCAFNEPRKATKIQLLLLPQCFAYV